MLISDLRGCRECVPSPDSAASFPRACAELWSCRPHFVPGRHILSPSARGGSGHSQLQNHRSVSRACLFPISCPFTVSLPPVRVQSFRLPQVAESRLLPTLRLSTAKQQFAQVSGPISSGLFALVHATLRLQMLRAHDEF